MGTIDKVKAENEATPGDSAAKDEIAVSSVDAGETTDITTIDVSNNLRRGFGDYAVTETLRHDLIALGDGATVITMVTADSTEPITTVPEETTTPVQTTTTTTAVSEQIVSADTTTTTEATTTEATTTAPVTTTTTDNTDDDVELPTDEMLTVSDGGVVVTDTAYNIITKVVQNEIGGGFSKEAIKAQAVAAYTYIKCNNNLNSAPYVLLKSYASDSVKTAVSEVLGEAIYYNGSLIQAVYGASTAGYAASSYTIFGVDYPYLQYRECELDKTQDINYGSKSVYTSAQIKNNVKNTLGITLTGNPKNWLKITEKSDSVFVTGMSIGGESTYVNSSGKTRSITGNTFREVVMGYDIKSTAFKISYDSSTDKFTITTYGYGHCVGLSQNGANALAKTYGYTYKDILQYYYKGVDIY